MMQGMDGADGANAHGADLARRRLDAQRLTRPDLATPAEVVRWFGATQAQEYQWSLYALGLRMPDTNATTEAAVERAIAARSIVRTWPMRGTIHYVPAEDARWMLRLLARRTNGKAANVYRRAGLSADDFTRAGAALAEALAGGKALPRKRLYAALEAARLTTGGEQRGLHLLGYWAREGLICLGPREGKQPTFTLLDEWVPAARQLDGDEALATLALRYFTSHGPATPRDLAWRASPSVSPAHQARRARPPRWPHSKGWRSRASPVRRTGSARGRRRALYPRRCPTTPLISCRRTTSTRWPIATAAPSSMWRARRPIRSSSSAR